VTPSDAVEKNRNIGHIGALIRFSFPLKKPIMDTTWVTNRAWCRLSHDAFASDLTASTLCCDPTTLHDMSADDLVYLYRDVMTELLDRHCPVVKVRRKAKPMTQWLDAECRAVRRRARAAERRFRRRLSDVDPSSWVASLKMMRSVYENKRDEFWRKQIAAK